MKKKKQKVDFSKIVTVVAITCFAIYGMYNGLIYNIQMTQAIENSSSVVPDPTLAVTCVGGILGSILSYLLYQAIIKNSLNKNHLTIDEQGIVKDIVDNDTKGVLDKILSTQEEMICGMKK